jgi:hypothetical protein
MFGLFKKKTVAPIHTAAEKCVRDVSSILERIEGVPTFSRNVIDVIDKEFPEDEGDVGFAEELTAATRSWLTCVNAEVFNDALRSGESANFILYGDVSPERGKAILSFTESTLARYREDLSELIHFGPASKMAILAFTHDDDYYRYASAYYPDGHFGLSSGMFLQRGLGHFVFPNVDEMWHLEPTIAHELFHAVVAHLPIPAWLNEGLATNAEFRYGNRFEDPRHADTQLPHHRRYWNAERLQRFWSGDAFHNADEGQELSYDLARRLVRGLSADWAQMQRFILEANYDDAGERAAHEVFGFSLAVPLEATIGHADVAPRPAMWETDAQVGGFQRVRRSS